MDNLSPAPAPSPAPSSDHSAEAVTAQPAASPATSAEPSTVASAIEQIEEVLHNPEVVSALAAEGVQIDHGKLEAALHDAAASLATRAAATVAQVAASEPAPAASAPANTDSPVDLSGLPPESSELKPYLPDSPALVGEPLTPLVPYLPHSPAPVADHAFVVKPTILDPLAQKCGLEGCSLSEIAHPDLADNASPVVFTPAEPSVADRVAVLEKQLSAMREKLACHGIRFD